MVVFWSIPGFLHECSSLTARANVLDPKSRCYARLFVESKPTSTLAIESSLRGSPHLEESDVAWIFAFASSQNMASVGRGIGIRWFGLG
jgi:hypothetical protein